MHCSCVPKSSSIATATSTSVTASRVSQPESAAEQSQQSSFVGLSTTVHTPESTRISSSYYQQDELRLLPDISVSNINASQTDSFEALATYQTVTFDDDHQGQSASSLSRANEPSRSQKSSQPVNDVLPIVREEQSPNPTDKWIMMSGDKKRPFRCGYQGCGRKYSIKAHLQTHFVTHTTGDSKLRCYLGECAGTGIYRDTQALTRHIRAYHTFEKPLRCELCDRRFRLQHHLKYHMKHVHGIEEKKKSPKPQSVSESSATATTNTASTSTITSGNSQPELAAGQRLRGPLMSLSTTVHTPESTRISSTYCQQDELRLLSDISVSNISASQTDSFEALATCQTVTFDDDHQGQSASSLSRANEPSRSQKSSQPVNDVLPIVREEQSPNPTDKWIMMSGDKKRPFRCGYQGCGRKYSIKAHLQTHFVTHTTGDSKLRCYLGECAGTGIYRDTQALTRHIRAYHTFEKPLRCELCDRRFRLQHHLKYHMKHVHGIEEKKKSPKPQSVSESSATATTNTASTSTITSGNSQPELAAGQRLRCPLMSLSTTVHTPESTPIPVADQQFAGLRLLADTIVSQADPFEAITAHRTVTFDDDHLEYPDNSSLQSSPSLAIIGESSQPIVVDAAPNLREAPFEIIVSVLPTKDVGDTKIRTMTTIPEQEILPSINDHILRTLSGIAPEAALTAIAGDPNLTSDQYQAEQSPDPTDEWIIEDKSQAMPYKCGYPGGCNKRKSKFKCPHPECVGNEYFRTEATLKRHIVTHHTSEKPFQCDSCNRRFGRKDYLKRHRKHVHGIEEEKKSPKRKRK